MTLYEMTSAAMQLYEMLQAEEIDEQTVRDTLEAIGTDEKLETYCKLIRQYDADAEAYKAEKERLAQKQKAAENAAQRMKDAVQQYMDAADLKKTDAGLFKVSIAETQSVEIDDETKLPDVFLIPQPARIDKAGLRTVLKDGGKIEGAHLKTNRSVRIK